MTHSICYYLVKGMAQKQVPKLYPQDYLTRALVLPFIPRAVQPNHITIVRFLLIPFILWLLWSERYALAFPVFFFAVLTDIVDGGLARVRDQITPWGILFDPIADKFLVGSVALMVALQHYHPWLVFLAILLDIFPVIRYATKGRAGGVMMANIWGKTKMFLQCLSLLLLLLGIAVGLPGYIFAGEIVLVIACAFALVAVVTYSL